MSNEEKGTGQEMADAVEQTSGKQEKTDTGMIGVEADAEIAATDTSTDTPIEALQEPLFDEVAPSEAELTGIEEETSSEKQEEEKEEQEEAEEKKEEEENISDEKSSEAKSAEEKSESEKPPAGYVPHAALHEERMMRQQLSRELADVRQELAKIKDKSQEMAKEEFKILSDKEFDELAEEDPAEALKYERQLNKYLREQDARQAQEKAQAEQSYRDRVVIKQSIDRMEKTVPGLHEEGNPINDQLTQFAIDYGFDPNYLSAMTSPGTLILPPGGQNAVLLGDGAASLVSMIYKMHSTIKENDPEMLRAQITKEVEKQLRTTITEELMTKFKSASGASGFKSIGDLPGSSEEIPSTSGGITEVQYANMSQAQRDKLLGA